MLFSSNINMSKNISPGSEQPSQCPHNSAFKQQKLPAWKPQLNSVLVLSTFFGTCLFSLAVGTDLLLAATTIKETEVLPLLKQGNTGWTDKNVKFCNPMSHNLSSTFTGAAIHPYWQKPAFLLDIEDEENNGYRNDNFIIWIRVAPFPKLKNFYCHLSHTNEFADGFPAGDYGIHISYNFLVTSFDGREHIVLSTVTWSGRKQDNSIPGSMKNRRCLESERPQIQA
ncbi:cell cycle control protein 50C-like [Sphaerodactylus townsendi]|uniref:cell cycle control protein 50C-like n=1 Tax=Sphaerodactylus townsendi TaxID=933632 RepID=UPI002025FFAD|nr:cell cycle control protein 50C-like [Sphaerodactylus townsendi]